ncbi:MAG: serine/threonine protein kinase [Planctomycetota bacterium]|nr:MAG: serine/threonine protein kinase [Planctomycetota bacterium]
MSSPDLDALVGECAARLAEEGGEALEELCAAHPQHAEALRARLRLLIEAGLLDASDELSAPAVPQRLGDFELLRLLGGGGMGVVYLARQQSLGRLVALKLIRPEHLYFPGARQRFRREVEAVARLQHPGIVPVHLVGAEGQLPYFAMEYVRGATLAEILRKLCGREVTRLAGRDIQEALGDTDSSASPLFAGRYEEVALRLIREVAEALEHAHRRGVLHRDVKPSNIMLTAEGRVMLLDFGVAATAGAGELTRTGSQPGSLPYMSPEQLRGEREAVDRRTDIYSLGVTLYELLTLRSPFAGASSEGVRRRVLEGRFERPRQRNPALTRDMEIVCTTAMESERERRYASAADFARDLGNVLEKRPIEARPAGVLMRAGRWVQRRPALASALLLGFLAFAVAPALLAWQTARSNAALRQEVRVQEEELDVLVALLDVPDPRVGAGERAPLLLLLDQAEKTAREKLTTDALLRARVLAQVGRVYANLYEEEKAEPPLRESLQLRRAQLAPDDLAVAESEDLLGVLLHQKRDLDGAEPLLLHALAVRREALGASAPTARSLHHCGRLRMSRRDFAGAAEQLQQAAAMREGLHLAAGAEFVELLADLGQVLLFQNDQARCESVLQRALALGDGLAGGPAVGAARARLHLARLRNLQGRATEGEQLAREAVELLRGAVSDSHIYLVEAELILSDSLRNTGKAEEAEEHFRNGHAMVRQRYPGHRYEGTCLCKLGVIALQQGAAAQAEELLRQGIALLERRVDARDAELIAARFQLASAVYEQRRYDEAEELLLRSRDEVLASFGPTHPFLADPLFILGSLRQSQQRFEEARDHYAQGLAVLSAEDPRRGLHMARLMAVCERLARTEEAVRWGEQALPILERWYPALAPPLQEDLARLGREEQAPDASAYY